MVMSWNEYNFSGDDVIHLVLNGSGIFFILFIFMMKSTKTKFSFEEYYSRIKYVIFTLCYLKFLNNGCVWY